VHASFGRATTSRAVGSGGGASVISRGARRVMIQEGGEAACTPAFPCNRIASCG